jgi:hypothetical protein
MRNEIHLPDFLDTKDAIDTYNNERHPTDALKAWVVGYLSSQRLKNKEIRESLHIRHDYEVSHLKKVARGLTYELLTLWHKNPDALKLGHMRAITSMPKRVREDTIRNALRHKITVHQLEEKSSALKRGEFKASTSATASLAEKMGTHIGRTVKIKSDPRKKMGSITLSWTNFADLDDICKRLGFDTTEHL